MERSTFLAAVFLDVLNELNNSFNIMQGETTDSEDENLVVLNTIVKVNQEPHRIKNYIEKTVVSYTEKEFQSHFRLKLTTYQELERMLGPQLSPETDPRKQLLSVLWLLATPDSFRSVGDRFDMAKSSLHKCFKLVVKNLNKMANRIIKWPNDREKLEVEEHFASFAGLRGCIGAVDGTFVEIKAPKEHPHVYTCRKNFYALQLQAISLPNLKFTDVFVGFPGSVGDRRVFTNSPIYKNIESNRLQYVREGQYILGDKAYPLLSWCIPPYIARRNLSIRQVNFNTCHSKTRQVIERTFALLFGRYRRLKFLDMNSTKFIPPTILACCVLHNLCLIDDDEESIEGMILEGEVFLRAQQRRIGAEESAGSELVNDSFHHIRDNLMQTLNIV